MNEVVISNINPPLLSECGLLAASEPVYHLDRVAGFNVLIYVTDGTIYVTEDDTDYEVNAGELLFLKSGLRHYGKRPFRRETRWYFFHFYQSAFGPEYAGNGGPAAEYERRITLPKKLSGLKGSRPERMIMRLNDFFYSNDPMKFWHTNSRLLELLTEIAVYRNGGETKTSLSDKICAYLSAHCSEPFSAAALEREFYLSYKYMAAVFKKERGETMQQYHTAARMDTAKRLLRSTFMSVAEVSAAAGYSDALYFSRRFRETTGMCPSEYRKTAVEMQSG